MRRATAPLLITLALAVAMLPLVARPQATAPANSGGGVVIDVTQPGRDLYRIAVPPDQGPAATARTVLDVLSNDLDLSGFFRVLDPRSFFANLAAEGMGIDPAPWTAVGAQAVVKARIEPLGGQVRAEFRLYETIRPGGASLQQTYTAEAADARTLGHRFANALIRYFTGTAGVFGSRLVFARRTSPGHKDVFTADFDGNGVARITNNGSINLLPAWAPGGGIYYTSFVSGQAYLYRTGRSRPILSRPGLNMGVAVSPRGNSMAVSLSEEGNPDIYLSDLDGITLHRLTNNPAIDISPAWSPDGSQLAFVSDRQGSPQIFVMNADGSGVRRVTFRGSYNQTPAWCPRAETPLIAFTARDGNTFDVFTVDLRNGQLTRLTQGQGRNSDPAWSPDGRLIAFYSSRGGIYLMNPDGTHQVKVINGHAESIRWSAIVPPP